VHTLKRLILPDPESASVKYYFDTLRGVHGRDLIAKMTKRAQDKDIKVRWSKEFIFHAITLADVDDPKGWAYVESALPFCNPADRPGYRVYRHRSEEAVRALRDFFLELWDASDRPPDDLSN
jgi:hypothetical protein